MSAVFFFYTIALIVISMLVAMASLIALISSRQRLFLLGAGTFLCYALELTEIFFFEYTGQNVPFDPNTFYAITSPFARSAIAIALLALIWASTLELLDRLSLRLIVIPIIALSLATFLIIVGLPLGPFRQWFYYTTRQIFLLFVCGYAYCVYRRANDPILKMRMQRFKRPFSIILILVFCIIAEDTMNILLLPFGILPDWLPMYLSERNFSENVFMLVLAYYLIKKIYYTLSIRISEPPSPNAIDNLQRHIEEQMPHFAKRYGLSRREAEILELILEGKTNQEIADELFLALGTVKTHVHNILKKSGLKSREALSVQFWQS